MGYSYHSKKEKYEDSSSDPRLRIMWVLFVVVSIVIVVRLFVLMVFQHSFYVALAAGSHEIYSNLFPERGNIFIQDSRSGEEYPLAMNRDYFLVYADTRQIEDDKTAEDVAEKLASVFSYDDEKKFQVFLQLNKRTDPYEPLEKKVDETVVDRLKELDLVGIAFVRQPFRYYPEGNLAAQVVGFLGKDSEGNDVGRYGVEGYWEKELMGKGGFVQGAKSAVGALIPLAGGAFEAAEDGADILLTIDRTIQYKSCETLEKYRLEFGATSASLVILDPYTGAIRAMCSLPDFDPNTYNQVESIDIYNNTNIFTSYEPGSIFKPVVMSAALNEGLLTPETYFEDKGHKKDICDTPIKNAGEKVHGWQTMTGVLENSINTGMVNVAERLGKKKLIEYIESYGFGVREGIELDTEMSGTIDALYINKGNKTDCYAATASFGQGITATPLQMVTAFSAIANGGTLMKPYVVERINYSDGKTEYFESEEIENILEKRSSMLLSGMLVSVIDSGHAAGAAVPGYYVAGKTGTAQIAGRGGYTDETNHSFVGFAPVDNPKFVMIVKFEKPQRKYSSSTAAPVFGDIAKFLLQYYHVPPTR
jgi:cell division protein FtsI/penicillin-binding protein 2